MPDINDLINAGLSIKPSETRKNDNIDKKYIPEPKEKVQSFDDALSDLIKSHIKAGESISDIGKQLKVAADKTMIELGKAHLASRNK